MQNDKKHLEPWIYEYMDVRPNSSTLLDPTSHIAMSWLAMTVAQRKHGSGPSGLKRLFPRNCYEQQVWEKSAKVEWQTLGSKWTRIWGRNHLEGKTHITPIFVVFVGGETHQPWGQWLRLPWSSCPGAAQGDFFDVEGLGSGAGSQKFHGKMYDIYILY